MANARGPTARRGRVRGRSALPTPVAAPDAADAAISASMSSIESLGTAQSLQGSQGPQTQTQTQAQTGGTGAQKARVLLPDDALVARAREAALGIDFPALTSAGALRSSWKHKARAGAFTTYSREVASRDGAGLAAGLDDPMDDHPLGGRSRRRRSGSGAQVFEVLAVGELACGLEELAHALRATSDVSFNAAMSGVHRKDFIYGSVVHVVPVAGDGKDGAAAEGGGDDRLGSLAAVKTSTFVRSSMFGQNEQWCFLELFRRSRFSRSFFVTASSLPARVLSVGKAQHGRVDHLHGLTTGYWVEELPSLAPNGKGAVRVVFFGQFAPNTVLHSEELGDGGSYAASNTAKKRLLRIARATGQLEDVVRRRRLGAQTLADRSAFDPKNSRCICCTKSLGLLTTKKRCYLCGYAVCDNCWSIQTMETRAAQVSTLRVCSRCLEFVDAGDYSHVTPDSLGPIQIVPDNGPDKKANVAPSRDLAATTCSTSSAIMNDHRKDPLSSSQSSRTSSKASAPARKNTLARQESSSSTRKPSEDAGAAATRKATMDDEAPVMLSDLLQDALKDKYYASRKQSVMTVMQQLLDEERSETPSRAKAYSVAPAANTVKSRPKSGLSSPPPSMASSSASTSSTASARRTTTPDEMMASLEEAIRGKNLPLEECVHATSKATGGKRKYALAPKEAPVPDNEADRLEAIECGGLMNLGDSKELDALCKLAAREMGCSTSVLTIVGHQEQRVLASNVSEMKHSQLPRNETFCQHTVMGEAPLLVPHPEADVRFQGIAARTQGGKDYRFYAGFPIRGENNAVVGAICVLDERSHDVTQTQFSAMQRLAQTASNLVQQTPAAGR